ncbi:MAG: hypothetical protein IKT27_02920 [Clostridia bacterium]|nr:hypothetical protein [Clostridia bacterium]
MSQIQQFLYPAVFVKGEDEVVATFPDLGITTDGSSVEEAFLFAKDYLRVYCTYALKYEIEINRPSFFEETLEKNNRDSVMLIDAIIFPEDLA